MSPRRFVVAPDGWKPYLKLADTTPFFETAGQFVRKWTDSEGNVWYRYFGTRTTVWESMWGAPGSDEEMKNPRYPAKIDTQDTNYKIYYKAQ